MVVVPDQPAASSQAENSISAEGLATNSEPSEAEASA
jgi:hypothetical protein